MVLALDLKKGENHESERQESEQQGNTPYTLGLLVLLRDYGRILFSFGFFRADLIKRPI